MCLVLTDVFSPGREEQRMSIRLFIKSRHTFIWCGLTPYSYHLYQITPHSTHLFHILNIRLFIKSRHTFIWCGLTPYSYHLYQITPSHKTTYLYSQFQDVHEIMPHIHIMWSDTFIWSHHIHIYTTCGTWVTHLSILVIRAYWHPASGSTHGRRIYNLIYTTESISLFPTKYYLPQYS